MNIKKTYPENLTNRQKYDLTMSPKTQKMSDAVGSTVEIEAWALYEDEDREGEIREILAIRSPEGEILATNSQTFKDDFFRMVDLFGPGVSSVEIISGKSKAGRDFITCAYAGE